MKLGYRTVYQIGEAEISEKKSVFMGIVYPIRSEEEAYALIEQRRKAHRGAGHNCYAFVLGKTAQLQRCSDDKEPSGTAGKPILEVLAGSGVTDALVIVTRYFGGVLLGTGGLVRAYAKAAKEALQNCEFIFKEEGTRLLLEMDYTHLGRVQHLLSEREIPIGASDYVDAVRLTIGVGQAQQEALQKALTECTNGQIRFLEAKECLFSMINGTLVWHDE